MCGAGRRRVGQPWSFAVTPFPYDGSLSKNHRITPAYHVVCRVGHNLFLNRAGAPSPLTFPLSHISSSPPTPPHNTHFSLRRTRPLHVPALDQNVLQARCPLSRRRHRALFPTPREALPGIHAEKAPGGRGDSGL